MPPEDDAAAAPSVYDPVILIHGAWQGSWVWARLLPWLDDAGLDVVAVDLPGNGATAELEPVSLESYVAHVGRAIQSLGRPVTVVGHSGGGIIASAVAEAYPDQVARIAYIAAMMLPDDTSFMDVMSEFLSTDREAAGVGPALVWSKDGSSSTVPPEAAVAYFLQDCDPEDAVSAAAKLTPQPESGRAIRARLTRDRFGRKPRLYIEAAEDRSVLLKVQRRMQALVPGAAVITLSTGHVPHFSAPRRLAEALIPFLQDRPPSPR